jgi:hypothetical protein
MGVAMLTLRGGSHPDAVPVDAPPAEVAVGVGVDGAVDPAATWRLDAGLPRLVNPNTATVPLCSSERDAVLLAAAHRRWPVLIRRAGPGEDLDEERDEDAGEDSAGSSRNPWRLRLVTPLHMTRDAVHFHSGPGADRLPLWEAKHAGLLDHRGGARARFRYWVDADLVRRRFAGLAERGWLAGYRNVTTTDSVRTLLPSPIPVAGVGNSFPLLDAPRLPLLLTALASLPVDYLVRQKHAGANLNFFKLEQAAVPPPTVYDECAPWQPDLTLQRWLLRRFAAAVRWDERLAPLAAELSGLGVDAAHAAAELSRERALAEIDAAHAVLLGWSRQDLEHVLSTFAALRSRELRAHGRYLTAERVLAAYDRLAG